MTREEMISAIESMTVLELNELVKALEEKFGVSAAAPVAVAAAPAAGAAAAPAAEEKTEFDVVLKEAGAEKIKEIVDGAPKTLKEGVSKDEAEKIKAKFAEVGATVEIK